MSDLISRQAAIDELSQRYIIMDNPHYIGYNAGLDEAQKVIKALPPVYVPVINVGDMISRQAAIDLLKQMRKDGDMVPWEGKDVFARIRKLPSVQPTQPNCEYCHTDRDGYVFPLEKNSHAFIDRDKIVLKAKGWRGEAKIKYCPICGRRLTDG